MHMFSWLSSRLEKLHAEKFEKMKDEALGECVVSRYLSLRFCNCSFVSMQEN